MADPKDSPTNQALLNAEKCPSCKGYDIPGGHDTLGRVPRIPPFREEVKIARAEKSLHYFMQYAWPELEQGNPFVDGWHIGFMCEVAQAVLPHRHLQNVLINIPPRHMKSLLWSVGWQAWLWGPADLPHLRMLNSSYAQSLSTRDSLKVRRLIRSHWYQERWGHRFRVLPDQDTKTRFDNDATGFRFSTSTGGMVTGEGGHLLNVDDAQSAKQALSEAHRMSLRDWWRTTWSSRLNDKATGCRVVTGQRLHQLDVVGIIEEQIAEAAADGVDLSWVKVVVPARYEGKRCTVVLPGKVLEDPRQKEGDPLWEAKMPDKELRKLESELGPYGRAGQLQQRPSPLQGGIFPRGGWKKWKVRPPAFARIFYSWDCSFKKGRQNSYVVGLEVGEFQGKLYVLRKVRKKMDWKETKERVKAEHARATAAHGRVDATLVEDKANGSAILSEFDRTIPDLVAIDPGTDSKEARADAASPYVDDGTVMVPEDWTEAEFKEWEDEFADFPNAAHNDQVDALSQLVIWWKDQRGGPSSTPNIPQGAKEASTWSFLNP